MSLIAPQPVNLWQAYEAAAALAGDRTALVLPSGNVSFRQLTRFAEMAANWLDKQGVKQGDIVAIHLPKRLETYALWLGAMRQGCPYVFVDPRNPPERNAAILARLKPRILVTEGETQNPFGATLKLENDANGIEWLASLDTAWLCSPAPVTGLDPAYVMFTSGSTGEPKGAVIPHQGVLSLMRWVREEVVDPSTARFSNINPLHFDNAVFDLFGGLANGATLVPVETLLETNPAHWVRRLRDGEATVIFAVPSLFLTIDRLRLLKPASLPKAKLFIFGGEGFPPKELRQFHARFEGQASLLNVYGPTETSCICSSLPVDAATLDAAGEGFVSLGRMHREFSALVVAESGLMAPAGEEGELWIGGPNVGLGYFANPDESGRRFVQDPRHADFRSVYYRSGDKVTMDPNGLLWFRGRVDNQVKIRGHRIELEEIDLAIEAFPGVRRAVSAAVDGPDGKALRAAFIADAQINIDKLIHHLLERLPHYMQPQQVSQWPSLPENANGKVDRRMASLKLGSEA